MGISTTTLMKIAGIGGFVTAAMGFTLRYKINNNIKQTEHYKTALKELRSHNGVRYLLGEPIQDGIIDVSNDERNYTKPLIAHYEVPVCGPKNKATLYFWANRKTEEDKWIINRMELQLCNEPDRKLLVKNIDN